MEGGCINGKGSTWVGMDLISGRLTLGGVRLRKFRK